MAVLNWGIIGTGRIAQTFAHGLTQTDSGRAVAVGSRTVTSAQAFADRFDIPARHGSYEALLADPEVQAVYVCTPHPYHEMWAVRAADAGKHVLCEKPMTLNRDRASVVVEAARRNGVFLMEAFMYRCHPQTRKLVDLIRGGAIGEVRLIRASFGYGGGYAIDAASRSFDKSLGGGGILDVGCYPVSIARLVAGASLGKPFADPVKVLGAGHLGETGVDEWASAVLLFERDIVAQVTTAVRASPDYSLEVTGAEGRIVVPRPWTENRTDASEGSIVVITDDREDQIDIPADRTSFAYEADAVARAIGEGRTEAESPAMSWDDTLGNLGTLDAWRAQIGLKYDGE